MVLYFCGVWKSFHNGLDGERRFFLPRKIHDQAVAAHGWARSLSNEMTNLMKWCFALFILNAKLIARVLVHHPLIELSIETFTVSTNCMEQGISKLILSIHPPAAEDFCNELF